jgi:hypothetical protein
MYFSGMSAPGESFCFLELGDVVVTDLRFRPLGGIFCMVEGVVSCSESNYYQIRKTGLELADVTRLPTSPKIGFRTDFTSKFSMNEYLMEIGLEGIR